MLHPFGAYNPSIKRKNFLQMKDIPMLLTMELTTQSR